MESISTHREVILYRVRGWDPRVHPASERYGATCEDCGVWRGPGLEELRETLARTRCAPPFDLSVATLSPAAGAQLMAALALP